MTYADAFARSIDDPEGFWADEAKELTWFEPWTKVLDESKKPFFKWFVGGKTNIAYNCLDAQIAKGLGEKVAIIFEGEPTKDGQATEIRRLTFRAESGARLIDWDQEFIASEGDAVFGDINEGRLALTANQRVALNASPAEFLRDDFAENFLERLAGPEGLGGHLDAFALQQADLVLEPVAALLQVARLGAARLGFDEG